MPLRRPHYNQNHICETIAHPQSGGSEWISLLAGGYRLQAKHWLLLLHPHASLREHSQSVGDTRSLGLLQMRNMSCPRPQRSGVLFVVLFFLLGFHERTHIMGRRTACCALRHCEPGPSTWPASAASLATHKSRSTGQQDTEPGNGVPSLGPTDSVVVPPMARSASWPLAGRG